MNTTEYFKRTIQAYLEERAMEDELFAAKYDNPDKNIDDCVTYILLRGEGHRGRKTIELPSVSQPPYRTHRGGEGTGKTGSHPPISARADEQDA